MLILEIIYSGHRCEPQCHFYKGGLVSWLRCCCGSRRVGLRKKHTVIGFSKGTLSGDL